ncbi:hypothetical protein [Nocardia sp. NPDC057440]|uniref:hypothetical protein n=1 Tax=Nocardia sp. NPDC057440 TaxID=3346134 RepID=UPI00366A8117
MVVQRQLDLGFFAAQKVEEMLIEGPSVGGDELWIGCATLILAASDRQFENLSNVVLGPN